MWTSSSQSSTRWWRRRWRSRPSASSGALDGDGATTDGEFQVSPSSSGFWTHHRVVSRERTSLLTSESTVYTSETSARGKPIRVRPAFLREYSGKRPFVPSDAGARRRRRPLRRWRNSPPSAAPTSPRPTPKRVATDSRRRSATRTKRRASRAAREPPPPPNAARASRADSVLLFSFFSTATRVTSLKARCVTSGARGAPRRAAPAPAAAAGRRRSASSARAKVFQVSISDIFFSNANALKTFKFNPVFFS